MSRFLFIAILLGLTTIAEAQNVRAIGSNLLRIGDGETDNGLITQRKRYLEEIANARIFFENLTIGLRYELSDPSEVGPNFQGIRRRWIEYKKDGLDLQAGDVFALYGRGLAVNMFESRAINYDSWLDGFSASYSKTFADLSPELKPSLAVNAIGGNKLFFDIDSTKLPLNISARAVNGQIGLFGKKLSIGASFIQAFTSLSEVGIGGTLRTTRKEVNQPEIYLSFLSGAFDGFLGFTEMRTRLPLVRNNLDSATHRGKAIYGALSYSGEEFGITVEYKDYQYFVHLPGAPYESYLGKLPLSSPPEVYKEFTYTSLTRTTHSVNFNDELGFQVEASITAIPDFTITLNAAASSRHYGFEFDSNFTPSIVDKKSFLPEFENGSHYPFWEAFAEVEYEMGDLDYIKFFAHRRSDVISSDGKKTEFKRSTTFGAKAQLETAESQSFLGSIEYQKMFDAVSHREDRLPENLYVVGQYSFNPIVTFGGIFDFSTDYGQIKHIWPQAFLSTRIGSAHTILVSYGAERGGLNCSGGVCRFVPAFDGFRLAVTSQI
jgi:hypothetical protein